MRFKKTSILDGDVPFCIDLGRLTLPAMLRKAGYRTGVVGKRHLGLGDGQVPVNFNQEIRPGPLLFNLAKDPSEQNNVIAQCLKVAEDLQKRLQCVTNPAGQ